MYRLIKLDKTNLVKTVKIDMYEIMMRSNIHQQQPYNKVYNILYIINNRIEERYHIYQQYCYSYKNMIIIIL